MKTIDLIQRLFEQGLGELLVMHVNQRQAMLGFLVYNKGKLVIRDQKFLAGIKPTLLKPCWDSGTMGMVSLSGQHEWASLTFYGLEQCDLKVDLGKTRHGAIHAAENQYGDNLLDFVGSIYRGYQLMLDNHFLPVVSLNGLRSKSGDEGLAVYDLRSAPMDLSVIRKVNAEVRKSIERHLVLGVEDVTLDSEQFDRMFQDYLSDS